ncbi:hypothetical protein ABIE89_000398 [Bradyrhizobium niftali]
MQHALTYGRERSIAICNHFVDAVNRPTDAHNLPNVAQHLG